MNDFKKEDRVVVNDKLPRLEGETGTVWDPEYLGYVILNMDNEELRAINCFLPEELEHQRRDYVQREAEEST